MRVRESRSGIFTTSRRRRGRLGMPFRDLAAQALVEKHVQKKNEATSLRTDGQRLNRILPLIGGVRIREFTPARISEALQTLARGDDSHEPISGATLNRYRTLLSSIFSYAVRNGLLETYSMSEGKVLRSKEPGVHIRYLLCNRTLWPICFGQ